MNVQQTNEIRELTTAEVDAVEGGFLGLLLFALDAFAIGVVGGAIACNVVNGQPWYSNDFEH